jgi:hypothetical protein
MSRAIIAAALLTVALPASAQHTDAAHAIAQFKQGDVAIRILVMGEVDGLGWANVDLAAPLFCQPVKLALSADQIFDIMERYLNSHPEKGQFPVGMVVKLSLKEAFPCKP